MSSLYTKEVQAVYHMQKKPFPRLSVDLVDYGPYLCLRFYRDNFESFSDDQKALITQWLEEVLKIMLPLVPTASGSPGIVWEIV